MENWKLKSMSVALAPIFSIALALPVYAANQSTGSNQSSSQQSQQNMREIRASELIGKEVRNAQGEDLGEIKDLVVDVNNARIHYVILSFGGFLGVGDKLFAYPVRVFKTSSTGDELVLNVDKEKLKRAPGFQSDRWPDWNNPDYRGSVDRYFGKTVQIEPRPNMRLIRASNLLGKDVNDANGKDIGDVKDLVINLNAGNVHYAVLDFDKAWSMNDKLIALPLRAFKPVNNNDELRINIDKAQLSRAPSFDKNAWPNVNDAKWRTDVDNYLVLIAPLPSTTNDALYARLDKDNNGIISRDEAKADRGVSHQWRNLDSNADGRLTRAEFDAGYDVNMQNNTRTGSTR